MQQIQVDKTLDVEFVEQQLAELWKETAGDADDEAAVLRARVANLLVYVPTGQLFDEVNALMQDVTVAHPSRALIMLGEDEAANQDIDMFVTSLCQTDKRSGARRLCGEVVVLKAQGKFTAELPSAALPLLVSDLATFLWWRHEVDCADKVFNALLQASDRLIIDSDEFSNCVPSLRETHKIFNLETYVGVSDLNWARLTLWRGLLADFYDVPTYQPLLDEVDYVRIDYVAPENEPKAVAPQALFIAGWLASRLGWTLSEQMAEAHDETFLVRFTGLNPGADLSSTLTDSKDTGERVVFLELNRVERGDWKPGRLVEVELRVSGSQPASFSVKRSADGLHVLAEANIGEDIHRGRILPVRNRSLAHLLSREMEILTNDNLYQEALAATTPLIDLLGVDRRV